MPTESYGNFGLGSGKRLFSEPDGQVPLALASSEAFGTGVVHLTYTPASA
jgi:hypothetical protein